MNKKSKKTLKNAFDIPEPQRKEEFFSSLETKQKKRLSFNMPLYISTAVTAVAIMGIWGGVKNLPYFEQPDNIDTPVYSETTSLPHHTEKSTVQTTTASSTKKNITVSTVAETSGISTVSGTEKINTTVSVQTTIKTETVITTTAKESKNISHKPTTKIRTTERTSVPEMTKKTTATIRTTITARTTTKTTAMPETTVTTVKPTTITTVKTTATTTRKEEDVNCVTTTKYANVGVDVPQTIVSLDFTIPTITTTTDDNGACTEPPRDFTVVPAVRYYPVGEIYITDSESNDGRPPALPGSVNDNEIFQKMAENSDLIVIVTVDEIIYTGFDGKPYTQENALVMNVIYGDIPVNSRISIYCKGGYIPASEYYSKNNNITENNVTVLDYAGNSNFSQVGDTYVCFLKKSDGDFPDESYYLTGLNDISKFAIYGDSCVNINNNSSLTLSQIQSFLNK